MSATPAAGSPFTHFASRFIWSTTPGQKTTAQSAAATTTWARSCRLGNRSKSTIVAASAAIPIGKLT